MIWEVLKWAAATAASFLIGYLLGRVLERSRLSLAPVEMKISSDFNERFMKPMRDVKVPEALKKLLASTLWASVGPFRFGNINYDDFEKALEDNEKRMRRLDVVLVLWTDRRLS